MKERVPFIWWLHPAFLVGTFSVVLGAAAYLYEESSYRANWRTPKFFDFQALLITLACAAVFAIGSGLSSRLIGLMPRTQASSEGPGWEHRAFLEKLFSLSFWLCVIGYGLWIGLAIQRGMTFGVLVGVLAGEKGAMYEARFTYLPTVGGVTTLTQFGTAAMIVGAMLAARFGWRTVRVQLGVVAGFAFLRALINSERFALIELFIPFVMVWIAYRYLGSNRQLSSRTRTFLNFAPLVGAVALFVVFTTFEYFRSWTNYYAGRDMTLWEFGAVRLLGYYVTSFNNGAYLLHRLDPLNAPYFTMHFLWTFPLTSPVMQRLFPGPLLDTSAKWFYFPFLESEANLEFNNADGQLFPLMDFGIAGGLIYWLVIGLICGILYELYRRKQLLGLLVYPVALLGMLEMPLALYWGEGRAFPSICLLVLSPCLLWLVRRQVGSLPLSRPVGITTL